jgi:molecular chaperone DnaK
MEINRPIGIDLGTTNSCVAVMNDTQTEIILYRSPGGAGTTPSCVWYDASRNESVVGPRAYSRRGFLPAPVSSIKRSMGKLLPVMLGKVNRIPGNIPPAVARALTESREDRLERYLARLEAANPKELEAVRQKKRATPPLGWIMEQKTRLRQFLAGISDPQVRSELEHDPPLLWLPEEVSALILAEERRQILEKLQRDAPDKTHRIDRALITVPAYFGAEQIEATREAGTLAGLEVLELLAEPSAAAVYYSWKFHLSDGLFLVFDLGGGTFDVSILRLQERMSQVLGTSGDNLLGGDDIDRGLAEWIRATLAQENPDYDLALNLEHPEEKSIWEGLVFLAEGAKKALSRDEVFPLRDTARKDRRGQTLAVDMEITRSRLEELAAPILHRCIPKCWEALAKAKLKADVSLAQVDKIFLVGGATHMPCVQRMVRERFCRGDGAATYTPAEIKQILEEIQGDDEAQTRQLRQLAQAMLEGRERARCSEPLMDAPDLCVAMGAAIWASRHGIRLSADNVGIEFTCARTTEQLTTAITGQVLGDPGADLENATVTLLQEALGVEEEAALSKDGRFAFTDVRLQAGTVTRFDVRVESALGEELIRVPLEIAQGTAAEGMGGPTVAKPYAIDVVRQGVVARKVLVASGVTLPTERSQVLAVPDPNKGLIHFNIYQGQRLLKCIEAFVDLAVKPGTPITFKFFVGADHQMRARYQFSGDPEEHCVVIEPPDSVKPSKEEIARLSGQIDDEVEYLDPIKRETYKIRKKKLKDTLQQAGEMADDAKLIDRFEELEALREEIARAKTQLAPPWQECEKLYQTCLEILNALKERHPNYPDDPTRENVREICRRAKRAYEEKDQPRYSEQVDDMDKICQALIQEYREKVIVTIPDVEQARQLIESSLEDIESLLRDSESYGLRFESRAKQERDEEERAAHLEHQRQCGQCKQNLLACQKKLRECKATYTQNPKEALENCCRERPIIANARIVLECKKSILDGKKIPEDRADVIPWTFERA